MVPLHEETTAKGPALDVRGRSRADATVDRFAGREQSWPGSSLALLGRERMAPGWLDLRRPALRDTSVATPSANLLARLPGGVPGYRRLPPFSTASRGKSVQCDSTTHLLFPYFHPIAASNYHRNNDVAGAECAVPMVSQNVRRPASGTKSPLHRSDRLQWFYRGSHQFGVCTWFWP